ncbi:MAG TPA: PspC domain-containing protein, partial [Saprospiraceae bacterium]|nr:PspC domain-containing protein [Saprospiraceae bacterium]
MNKILNINLGGYALTIDDDAYEYLTAYLESIRKRFSESEGRDEIVHDIESRLGEIISQSMGNRTIVMMPDAEAAVEIMGKPEEFGEEPVAGSSGSGSGSSSGSRGKKSSGPAVRTGKRLFRDEEDATVGGVCSGLSAYFGIADPLWMRLIFVLLTFLSAGFWIPAYILLWILVPPAKTAADRLAMRGEPINVDNIAKEIEDSFERLGTQFGAEKKSGAGKDRSFSNAMSSGVSVLGQMFGFVLRFVAKFGLIIATIVAIALFIALAVSWVAGIWGLMAAAPFVDYFSPYSSGVTWLGFANLFFLLSIPILGLTLMFARALFKVRTPGWLRAGLGLFWTVNLISAIFLTGFAVKDYRQGGSVTKTLNLSGVTSDTLRVEAANYGDASNGSFWWFGDEDGVRIGDKRIEIDDLVEIRVRRSDSDNFKCTQTIHARGSSNRDAIANAEETEFAVTTDGNVLRVPTSFGILQGKKWRGQHVRIMIDVPVGKSIVFNDKVYRHAAADMDEYADDNDRNYISRSPDKVFRMTGKGLICTGCPQFGDRDYDSEEYYEDFILEGDFETEMRKGNEFKIRFEGPADAIEKIRTGRKLTLSKKGTATGVKVFIESPVFTSLVADNTGNITIRGFEEGDASITVKGNSRIKAYIDVSDLLNVSLTGKCALELVGNGGRMDAGLNDGATLESMNWRARDVEITASGNSNARVYAKEDALVISENNSQVKVEGGA